ELNARLRIPSARAFAGCFRRCARSVTRRNETRMNAAHDAFMPAIVFLSLDVPKARHFEEGRDLLCLARPELHRENPSRCEKARCLFHDSPEHRKTVRTSRKGDPRLERLDVGRKRLDLGLGNVGRVRGDELVPIFLGVEWTKEVTRDPTHG